MMSCFQTMKKSFWLFESSEKFVFNEAGLSRLRIQSFDGKFQLPYYSKVYSDKLAVLLVFYTGIQLHFSRPSWHALYRLGSISLCREIIQQNSSWIFQKSETNQHPTGTRMYLFTPSFLWSASPCGNSFERPLVWVEGAVPVFYIQEVGWEEGSHCTTMGTSHQAYGQFTSLKMSNFKSY